MSLGDEPLRPPSADFKKYLSQSDKGYRFERNSQQTDKLGSSVGNTEADKLFGKFIVILSKQLDAHIEDSRKKDEFVLKAIQDKDKQIQAVLDEMRIQRDDHTKDLKRKDVQIEEIISEKRRLEEVEKEKNEKIRILKKDLENAKEDSKKKKEQITNMSKAHMKFKSDKGKEVQEKNEKIRDLEKDLEKERENSKSFKSREEDIVSALIEKDDTWFFASSKCVKKINDVLYNQKKAMKEGEQGMDRYITEAEGANEENALI